MLTSLYSIPISGKHDQQVMDLVYKIVNQQTIRTFLVCLHPGVEVVRHHRLNVSSGTSFIWHIGCAVVVIFSRAGNPFRRFVMALEVLALARTRRHCRFRYRPPLLPMRHLVVAVVHLLLSVVNFFIFHNRLLVMVVENGFLRSRIRLFELAIRHFWEWRIVVVEIRVTVTIAGIPEPFPLLGPRVVRVRRTHFIHSRIRCG